ncbi:hypothetical protein E4U26_007763 [Claviceps purpurea]|nr:hypothetical protein E4U51_007264 [Claviceps purpurea]KAG6230591.1 hypothetical protein E4U26_007763 [Claviceps purpurea]
MRYIRTGIPKRYKVQDNTQDNRAIQNVIPPRTSRPLGEPVEEANSERSVEINWFSTKFPMAIQQPSPAIRMAVQAFIGTAEQRVAGEDAARQEDLPTGEVAMQAPDEAAFHATDMPMNECSNDATGGF